MNLKEQAAQYITDNGTEKVASALGVKESTVKSWLISKKFPVELIELMLSSQEQEADEQDVVTNSGQPEEPDVMGVGPDVQTTMLTVLQQLAAKVEALETAGRPAPLPLAEGPKVVQSTDPNAPQFEVTKVVPGIGNSLPAPTMPDAKGMHMSQLLAKKVDPLHALLAQLLAAQKK